MADVSVPCSACEQPIRRGDEFCATCGAPVSREAKAALLARLEVTHVAFATQIKKVRSAQTTIAVLSGLFVVSGILFFFITRGQADDALTQLAGLNDSETLVEAVAGATTVGELRGALEREPYQVLGLNLFLAVVMLGLWFWSKRATLPAIITAFGIYVAVLVASALQDPTTLAQGVVLKIIVIAALARGVSAALAARRLETEP